MTRRMSGVRCDTTGETRPRFYSPWACGPGCYYQTVQVSGVCACVSECALQRDRQPTADGLNNRSAVLLGVILNGFLCHVLISKVSFKSVADGDR